MDRVTIIKSHRDASCPLFQGIVYKKQTPSPSRCPDLVDSLKHGMRRQDIQVQFPERRIGNREGLDLLDEMDSNKRRLTNIEDTVEIMRAESIEVTQNLAEVTRVVMEAKMDLIETKKDLTETKMEMTETKVKLEETSVGLTKAEIELAKNQAELDETKVKARQSDLKVASLIRDRTTLRHGVLEEKRVKGTTNRKDGKKMRKRNQLAHGGCVVGDVDAIRDAQTAKSPHVPKYKKDFLQSYGVTFEEAEKESAEYSDKFEKMLNMRACIRDLRFWGKMANRERRKELEILITQTVDHVLATDKGRRPDNGILENNFKLICQKFNGN